ncbi:hypothetical protein B0J13DRAFT_530372 [Dactylonectria estremocensis]|uniref:Uncharacterized protein n=1 Tax=Dactylonectria estremocensis TaxID=1079267 RepID=A0A9P9E431_9HYPO|nr:hypothetical protein B0J13DRAFT_530372 [Dactylonectria estremocensis]
MARATTRQASVAPEAHLPIDGHSFARKHSYGYWAKSDFWYWCPASNSSTNGVLSVAAKAGIGGVVGGGVLLLIIVMTLFVWKRKRARGVVSTAGDDASASVLQ